MAEMVPGFGVFARFERRYEVRIVDDSVASLATSIGDRRALVVTTPTVAQLYGDRLRQGLAALDDRVAIVVVDCDENDKSMAAVLDLCGVALEHRLGRRDLVVAFGGGICCDLVSLTAALVRRGIPYICVPTTLVGQIDAGIGLKGSVNFNDRKSFLGCFMPPEAVLVETPLLWTLPARELACGMAEMFKIGLALDRDLFELLQSDGSRLLESAFREPDASARDAVARSIELMLDELAPNPFEDQSFERAVDFGHTFSPALEERSDHGLKHGEAVAIDIALSSAVGVELGLFEVDLFEVVIDLLRALALPTWSHLLTVDDVRASMLATAEHRDHQLNLVVPVDIGKSTFIRDASDVSDDVLHRAIDRLARSVVAAA